MPRALRCPTIEDAMRLLEEKKRLAVEVYKYDPERRKFVFDVSPIVRLASHKFGRLQRIDESIEPDENAYRSILETLPGILACMHLHYKERGVYKNEVLAIEGAGGIGKSTIAYYLAAWLGGIMLTPEKDPIVEFVKIVSERKWYPIIVLDDIVTVISKYWIFLPREERIAWTMFFQALDYIRDVTGLLLFTARSFSGLAKKFRELSTMVGTMKRVLIAGEYIVDIIEWRPADTPRTTRPEMIDIVWPGIRIPDEEFRRSVRNRLERAKSLLEKAIVLRAIGKKQGQAEESGEEDTEEEDGESGEEVEEE